MELAAPLHVQNLLGMENEVEDRLEAGVDELAAMPDALDEFVEHGGARSELVVDRKTLWIRGYGSFSGASVWKTNIGIGAGGCVSGLVGFPKVCESGIIPAFGRQGR